MSENPIVRDAVDRRADQRTRTLLVALGAVLVLSLLALGAVTIYAMDQKGKAAEAGQNLAQRVRAACADPDTPIPADLEPLCEQAKDVANGGSDTAAIPGPRGEQGPAGPAGPPGPRGLQGVRGVGGGDGQDGKAGQQGAQGAAGAPGKAGVDGEAGPAGQDGQDGPQGPAGPEGPQGPPGPPGPQGPPGQDGQNPTCPDGSQPEWTRIGPRYLLTCPAA